MRLRRSLVALARGRGEWGSMSVAAMVPPKTNGNKNPHFSLPLLPLLFRRPQSREFNSRGFAATAALPGGCMSSSSPPSSVSSGIEEEERKMEKGLEQEEEEEKPSPESPWPLPSPPEKPLPGDCCGSGCVRCVWDVYYEELEAYNKLLSTSKSEIKKSS